MRRHKDNAVTVIAGGLISGFLVWNIWYGLKMGGLIGWYLVLAGSVPILISLYLRHDRRKAARMDALLAEAGPPESRDRPQDAHVMAQVSPADPTGEPKDGTP